ncbi:hypothetical protein J3A83DRAFT_4044901, partial [Scleroderma citrinum]
LLSCNTEPSRRDLKTDHLSIFTQFDMTLAAANKTITRNHREVDWEAFNSFLDDTLSCIDFPSILGITEDF